MSDISQVALVSLRAESPAVDAICRQLERQVDEEEAAQVVAFTEMFFSKATDELLHERSSDALARVALGAWRFLQSSHADQVDVDIFNPDVDNEGWYAPVTVVRTSISERPFIVDSIREFLHSQDLSIEYFIYPVLHVERGGSGEILAVTPSGKDQDRESLVHCEVTRIADPEVWDSLREELKERLQDVVRATDDFRPMVNQVGSTVAELSERISQLPQLRYELDEIQAFLRWLIDGAFIFLGYRGYDFLNVKNEKVIIVHPGSGLGILRNEAMSAFADPVRVNDLKPEIRDLVLGGPQLFITKTNALSRVHRLVRMDYIGVKKLSPAGKVVGEHRFIGLFASKAYKAEPEKIPILRHKLKVILDTAGVKEGTHDYKEYNTIFSSMPKEELFLSSPEQISADIQIVLTAQNTDDARVTVREDPVRRGIFIMVILPKDRFSGDVRHAIEKVLIGHFQAEVLNYHLAISQGDQTRLHFHLSPPGVPRENIEKDDLESAVRDLIRSWEDRVRTGLEKVRPADEARRLTKKYAEGFSAEYRAAMAPNIAVRDILELEAMVGEDRMVSISFSSNGETEVGEETTQLKLYLRKERLILSDFMPILENAGLRVIAVVPHEVGTKPSLDAIIYSFSVQDSAGSALVNEDDGTLLAEAILAVRCGDATNDSLNALVLLAGLSWREVDVLRAYVTYAFQLGIVPSRLSLPTALIKFPDIARTFFDIFEAKFDTEGPVTIKDRETLVKEIQLLVAQGMTRVAFLADDRALKRMLALLEATVRTNYFRSGGRTPTKRSGGAPYISLKIAVRKLHDLAPTKLLYEVWVRSSRMEGIHLRGADVARGGIRYSNRPDDFRTEIVRLVNTQMVKNAVIIPAGSKGGFVTLRTLKDQARMADEAREQYVTLIRGLFDITDNLGADGSIISPEGVVCWDGPDPYLVVAADKGTARYSDVANEVAKEYQFWLGDAFASGGSQGYDHKAVAITARGVWECVKRHFREQGKDIQAEPFTVVGVGDMSGDVFGNGMLLSKHIRLIAAFDHRHVFIDPTPDTGTSFRERERLFKKGSSSWDDYDRSCLSPGGMIISRETKEVDLTSQAREALGIPEDIGALDGEALLRAVLSAPVELFWNGGIGTYVKAPHESNAEVGDPSNDAVRLNSDELRCRVVGEGGNLGFTQEARIDFALTHGRINTDALDNSGGVDLSDREVNLKILLGNAIRSGNMSEEERNRLLENLTDPISSLVLADSESQSLAVSLDELRARDALDDFRESMSSLERSGVLNRAAEHLPTWEVLRDRLEERGRSLTRPELSVLLAHGKMDLMSQLLRSRLPDDPVSEGYLRSYFPEEAVRVAGETALLTHRLRRPIVASQLTNDLVGLMGATFMDRIARDTGSAPADIARAWLIAAHLADHNDLTKRVRGIESRLPPRITYRWLLGLSRVLERTTRWLLSNFGHEMNASTIIEQNLDQLVILRGEFGNFVAGDDRVVFERRVAEIERHGAEPVFARNLITLRFLDQLLEILRLSRETSTEPLVAGRVYYRISELLQIPWLQEAILRSAREDRWEQRAAQALVEELSRAHSSLTSQKLESVHSENVQNMSTREYDHFRELMGDVRSESSMSLSGLSIAVREITLLATGMNKAH